MKLFDITILENPNEWAGKIVFISAVFVAAPTHGGVDYSGNIVFFTLVSLCFMLIVLNIIFDFIRDLWTHDQNGGS